MAEIPADVPIIIHKTLPNRLSEHESAHVGLALVQKQSGLIVSTIIGSDYDFILKPNDKPLFPIDFETYFDGAFLHENYFLDFL